MKLTLSFDNGPDPVVTPGVLDVLDRHGVSAHFFVLGQLVATPAGRSLVERTVAAGHRIGNHSYTHAVPLGDDPRPDAVAREIEATEALLAPFVRGAPSFRPFGGGGVLGPHLLSPEAAAHLQHRGYTCVLWNSVPRDWVDPATWPATALADLDRRPHTLLVLHDIVGACLDQLDAFLRAAMSRGHEITNELPAECVPIRAGAVVGDLRDLVRARPDAPNLAGAA
jgi:peptidoglycan/xylan/chitin deacetylase (PgdA/CDA1 family)